MSKGLCCIGQVILRFQVPSDSCGRLDDTIFLHDPSNEGMQQVMKRNSNVPKRVSNSQGEKPRQEKRQLIASLLRRLFAEGDPRASRPIHFEPLETRQLMAADFFQDSSVYADTNVKANPEVPAAFGQAMMTFGLVGEGEQAGEGEGGQNLVEFAKALTQAGVRFFGADWCPICTQQKQLFEDGASFLPFIEVTNPDRTRNTVGVSENITQYPTWEFPNGTRVTGLQTLAQLSTQSGVAIPTTAGPTFNEIANQTVRFRQPLHIPVDAYDPSGGPLTITVSSSNPSVVSAQMITDTKSLKLSVNNYGDMVFRLFATEAPLPVQRIETLVNNGFYDQTASNKIIFHRVIDNFVLQAGDPTGTGSGGSTLGNFNDQFNTNLLHNRTGILSYAKSSDDTNDSQFFITEGLQQHLDFNHSVFGQLIEGDAVREGISRTSVSNSRPVNEISINNADIFNDTENGLIRLIANGESGTSVITVQVRNAANQTFTRTFTVTAAADNTNGSPFLNAATIPATIPAGQATTVQLSATDKEGDAVRYSATRRGSVDYQFNINENTGQLSVTPPANYSGPIEILVSVTNASGTTTTQDKFDTQVLTFNVVAAPTLQPPTSVTLTAETDTGVSNSDRITSSTSTAFTVAGTTAGATVNLRVGGTIVGTALASGSSTTVTANLIAQLGQGTHQVVATQTLNGVTTNPTAPISVTVDSLAPVSIAANKLPTNANVGTALQYDLAHPEEGNGLRYSFDSSPPGMSVNPTTGVISWTPLSTQVGPTTVDLRLTDPAGNFVVQQFGIVVAEAARVRVQMLPFDLQGNALTSLSIGQEFNLRVVVTDLRNTGDPEGDGVFSAYLDLEYDPSLIELVGTTPVTLSNDFRNGQRQPDASVPGLLDEFGAFSNFNFGPGRDPQLLATIRMRAKASGQALFTTNPAETSGQGISVFKINGPVPSNLVTFESRSLAIGTNFTVVNDVFSVPEDSTNFALNPLTNDTVVAGSGAVLSIQTVGASSQGATIAVVNNGAGLTYTPAANFVGTDTFTYTVRDQSGATSVGTITVQVTSVNDPPVANDDQFTARAGDNALFLNVLGNDTMGPDTGETLRVTNVSAGSAGGTIAIASSGNGVLYTPRLGFTGTETFTYTLSDGNGGTDTASVTVTVGPAVTPPTVVNDSFSISEDAAVAEFNVLANDTPAETGNTLSIITVNAPRGTATITSNGTRLSYQPAANDNGVVLVTYTARSSNGGVATGTATFTIAAVNDAPNAVDDSLQVTSQPNQSVNVLANDVNPDSGETLTITAVTQPPTGQGTVSIAADGKSLIYTAPNVDFTGSVQFTYTLSDGSSLTDTATVTLNVVNFRLRNVGVTFDSTGVGGVNASALYVPSVGDTTPVTRPVTIVNNTLQVQNVGPGTVQFSIPALPFRTPGTQQVSVTSAFDDSDSVSTPVSAGVRDARFIDLRDFMGQNVRPGLFVAVAPNQSAAWHEGAGGWSQYSQVNVRMNQAGSQLTVSARSPSNQQVSTSLAMTDNRVQVRARQGDNMLVRINEEPANLFSTATTSNARVAAEGEGPSNATLNAQSVDAAMQQIRGTTQFSVPMEDIDSLAQNTLSNASRRGFRVR